MNRRHLPPLLAVALLALAGCERDEIRTYTVPKPPPAPVVTPKVRLLGGIFARGQEQWFFKLAGPVEEVGKLAGDFEKFLGSVRFSDKADAPIEWKLPPGWEWEKAAAGSLRYATIFPSGKGKKPELTVSRFDRVSSVIDNVNRWARQDLGRPPLDDDDLAEVVKTVEAGPVKGTMVNLTGPGPREHPPMAGGRPEGGGPRKPRPLPISYTTPAGWVETGPRGGFVPILTAFDVGGKAAELQVTQLGGMTGEPLANLNRWRGQVGLPPVEKIDPPPASVKVDGESGQYFDLGGGSAKKRMLLVVVKRQQQTWYIKLFGDADVVGKNRREFESFVQSVKFTGGADE